MHMVQPYKQLKYNMHVVYCPYKALTELIIPEHWKENPKHFFKMFGRVESNG
jgi:hypothetical protein